jgi:hypothetical protein
VEFLIEFEAVANLIFLKNHNRNRLLECLSTRSHYLTVIDGDINLNTRLNANGGDLLDNFTRGMQINNALVDAHLEGIKRVGTVSGRSLTSGHLKNLGWHADRSADMELLVGGTLLQVSTNLLEVLDIAGCQGDTNAVDNLFLSRGDVLLGRESRHDGSKKLFFEILPTVQ